MRLFVTGTGTGVGKTTVACALVRGARSVGLRACGVKPIETGCAPDNIGERPADALALAGASAVDELVNECVYRFTPAVAPGVAARDAGVTIDLDLIRARIEGLSSRFPDLIVVEGAGGLLVPLSGRGTVADLATCLGAAIVVVGHAGLGTINHTLMTLEVARHRHLQVVGFVLSCERPDLDPRFVERNRGEIEDAAGIGCLGVIPHLDPRDSAVVSLHGRRILDSLPRAAVL